MPSSKKLKGQSGGINVKGSVAAQGDLVGRDKIIQNIMLVGQFLDFTKVEGLIPKPSTPADFESVSAAFEATFSQRLDGDLARATAFAGEVLSEVIREKWISGPILTFRAILDTVPIIVCSKLKKLDYWDSFRYSGLQKFDNLDRGIYHEVIWLHSLELLWKKHFKENRLYGIGYWEYDDLFVDDFQFIDDFQPIDNYLQHSQDEYYDGRYLWYQTDKVGGGTYKLLRRGHS